MSGLLIDICLLLGVPFDSNRLTGDDCDDSEYLLSCILDFLGGSRA